MPIAMTDPRRARRLNDVPVRPGAIAYWMRRDQRADDNWALLHAAALAKERKEDLFVVVTLDHRRAANERVYDFMLRGLQEVEADLRAKGIPSVVLLGDPAKTLVAWCAERGIGAIVADFSPLRMFRTWSESVARADRAFFEVDAHNVVPTWIVSDKKEYAARTIRPKIHRLLPTFLTDIPKLPRHAKTPSEPPVDWKKVRAALRYSPDSPGPVAILPGPKAAKKSLHEFLTKRIHGYDEGRNDPNLEAQSGLSPYLHFGHIAPQRVAYEALRAKAPATDRDAFIEELVVRRELSDNFCLYEPRYDQAASFPNWAARSLDAHRKDERTYVYDLATWERAETHDPLWNAAQREMAHTGKMHGYMRMYWAKKILEWSATPEDATRIAIALNDRWSIDGRDPNGYAGIAWSVGGVHDRPWGNRPVFGGVRYMNDAGCRRKFDVAAYIARWSS